MKNNLRIMSFNKKKLKDCKQYVIDLNISHQKYPISKFVPNSMFPFIAGNFPTIVLQEKKAQKIYLKNMKEQLYLYHMIDFL